MLSIIYVGAFNSSRNWGDLYLLILFGLIGWFMKQFRWPRPPLILGFILGGIIERYMFISVGRYGLDWLGRPVVVLLLSLAVLGLMRPLFQDYRRQRGARRVFATLGRPRVEWGKLFTIFYFTVIGIMVLMSLDWNFTAKIVPSIVVVIGFTAIMLSLLNQIFRNQAESGELLSGAPTQVSPREPQQVGDFGEPL